MNFDGFLFTGEWTSGYRAEIRARVAGDFVGWETDNLKFETRTGSLTVTDNAAGSPHSAALNGTGVPPATPKGVYPLTVTATLAGASGTVTHTIGLTLTMN